MKEPSQQYRFAPVVIIALGEQSILAPPGFTAPNPGCTQKPAQESAPKAGFALSQVTVPLAIPAATIPRSTAPKGLRALSRPRLGTSPSIRTSPPAEDLVLRKYVHLEHTAQAESR